jgi:iron complex transport system substrate-binding protein
VTFGRPAVLCAVIAVHAAAAQRPISAVDGDGDTVRLRRTATRVVSLVPDATELLIAIGATGQLVGRTQFDAEPEIGSVPSVGGMVAPDLERVRALSPDLVIIGTGEKRAATRAMLRQMGLATYAAPIHDTTAFFQSARALGALLGRDSAAAATTAHVRAAFASVHAASIGRPVPTVAFVMIGNPPTTSGPGTFIAQLIGVAGGRNVFDDAGVDWPRVSTEEIVRRAPDVVLVAARDSAGADARALQAAPGWRSLEAAHRGRIVSVPADLTDRPGPHMAELVRVFQRAFARAP